MKVDLFFTSPHGDIGKIVEISFPITPGMELKLGPHSENHKSHNDHIYVTVEVILVGYVKEDMLIVEVSLEDGEYDEEFFTADGWKPVNEYSKT